MCHKGDEEGKGERDKVLKAIDEFGKQLEFQMSWLNEAVLKRGEGGDVTALDTHCHTSPPARSPSPLYCRSAFHTLTVASVPLCRPANLLHIL